MRNDVLFQYLKNKCSLIELKRHTTKPSNLYVTSSDASDMMDEAQTPSIDYEIVFNMN